MLREAKSFAKISRLLNVGARIRAQMFLIQCACI